MVKLVKDIGFAQTGLLPALVSDYISGNAVVSHLTKYPFQLSAFKNVIADKDNDNTDRKLLVEVLQSQYATIPASQSVTHNIQLLLSNNTFTIVAAHQPCLFMGPLYNIYKIACTINVSNQLKQQYPDYNFVPVFWMGSEDHDVEELNHAYVNGKKIEWKNSGSGAVGRWQTATLKPVIDEFKTDAFNSEIITILEEGLKKYKTFGRFTQYFINGIFKEHGLVVIDQDDVALKRKFNPIIKDEVLHSRAVETLQKNIEFLEANYKVQAKPRDINFFYLGENYRERIVFNSSTQKFEINNTSVSFSRDEIISEIENHPERFSPNVILRPLFQEIILPNLAFVGGAGELSYWLELKPLFDYYKVNYPMLVMRNSAVILNSSTQKKMEKLALHAEDFFEDVELLINRYIKANTTVDADFADDKKKLEAIFDLIVIKAEQADVTLKQSALGEKQKALSALQNIEAKMLKAEKRKQETTVNQIRTIHSAFFQDNTLQERRENFIPYYNKKFIAELVDALDGFSKSFKVFVEE